MGMVDSEGARVHRCAGAEQEAGCVARLTGPRGVQAWQQPHLRTLAESLRRLGQRANRRADGVPEARWPLAKGVAHPVGYGPGTTPGLAVRRRRCLPPGKLGSAARRQAQDERPRQCAYRGDRKEPSRALRPLLVAPTRGLVISMYDSVSKHRFDMLGIDVMLENGVRRGRRKQGLRDHLDEKDVREESDEISRQSNCTSSSVEWGRRS